MGDGKGGGEDVVVFEGGGGLGWGGDKLPPNKQVVTTTIYTLFFAFSTNEVVTEDVGRGTSGGWLGNLLSRGTLSSTPG